MDDFNNCIIWQTANECLMSQKKQPTSEGLVCVLKHKVYFTALTQSLWQIPLQLRFWWKQAANN
jgi:hypothetical protein